jgi:hypothetical protein
MLRFLKATVLSAAALSLSSCCPSASAQPRDAQPASVVATPIHSVDAADAAALRGFIETAIRRTPVTRAEKISIWIDEPEFLVKTGWRGATRSVNRIYVMYTITDQRGTVLESQKLDAGRTVRSDIYAVERRLEQLRVVGEYIASRAARLDH